MDRTVASSLVLAAAVALAACGGSGSGPSRDQIRAVGSSTVYPFGKAVAEALAKSDPSLTPVEVYNALAANPFGQPNTAKNWSDINPALPATPILVYGPPSTSGTRYG